jgi:hypothetical protein
MVEEEERTRKEGRRGRNRKERGGKRLIVNGP